VVCALLISGSQVRSLRGPSSDSGNCGRVGPRGGCCLGPNLFRVLSVLAERVAPAYSVQRSPRRRVAPRRDNPGRKLHPRHIPGCSLTCHDRPRPRPSTRAMHWPVPSPPSARRIVARETRAAGSGQRFKGTETMAISCSSSSHGSGVGSQVTNAFCAIHSDSRCSPSAKVRRLPLPTR